MNKYLLTILCILIVSAGISSVSAADFNTTADNDFVQTQIDNNTQISIQKHNRTAETQNNDTTQNSEKIAQILDNTTVTNSDDEKANTQNTVVVDNGDGFNRLTPEDIQHFQERKEDDPHKLPINKHVKADIDNNMGYYLNVFYDNHCNIYDFLACILSNDRNAMAYILMCVSWQTNYGSIGSFEDALNFINHHYNRIRSIAEKWGGGC